MASNLSIASYKNLSLCAYVGNITSINENILFNYCSRFGTVVTSSFQNIKFCDFGIIEFAKHEQLERFLNKNGHEIDSIKLDVKLYKNILMNNVALKSDRKFFIGPILSALDIHKIEQFYKKIDPSLHYCIFKQDNQTYLLFEFSDQQTVTIIFKNQTIPTNEHREFRIYKPIHPKNFINKIISMNNKDNQIYVERLTNNITETDLIEYFTRYAPVIACHILSNYPNRAVIEFNDKRTVRKILETTSIRVRGTNLLIRQASHQVASLLSSSNMSDDDDADNEVKSIFPLKDSNLPYNNNPSSRTTYQESFQHGSSSLLNPKLSPVIMEQTCISSTGQMESGWSSPPRTIIIDDPANDSSLIGSSSPPTATTTSNYNVDIMVQPLTTDTDIKPNRIMKSNNMLHFVEQYQNELDQIKNEYMSKFAKDRTYIEQEINLLIDEERQTLDKINRYLNDQRRRVEKRKDFKRKHSPASSTH